MSIFMKATIKVDAFQIDAFLEVLNEKLVPMFEQRGWRLHGCFVQRFGPVRPAVVVDLWEMEDMSHVERIMDANQYRTDPRYRDSLAVLKSAVLEEKLEFLEFKMGRIEPIYP